MRDDWVRIEQIEGFFTEANYMVWRFFFRLQKEQGVTGNLCEIGMWRGRSAAALALHCEINERLVLCDPWLDESAAPEALGKPGIDSGSIVVLPKSSSALSKRNLERLERTFRWIHISGDHSAEQTYFDMGLASTMLSDCGIICLDGFFNARYVSVAWAAFSYLRNYSHSLRLILAGDNKAYFCRPKAVRLYRNSILSDLPGYIQGSHLALHQSEPFSDCETLGLQPPVIEGATFVGLDEDQNFYEVIERRKL